MDAPEPTAQPASLGARLKKLASGAYAQLEPEERHGLWRPHERWGAISRAALSTGQNDAASRATLEAAGIGAKLDSGLPEPWPYGFGAGADLPKELQGAGELALQALGEALSQNLPEDLDALSATLAARCAGSLEVAPAEEEDLFDDWLGITRFSGGERHAPCGVWISAAHGAQLPEAHPWSALIALCLRAQDVSEARRDPALLAHTPPLWTAESDWDRQPVFVHWTHPDFGLLSAACLSRLTRENYAQARARVGGSGIRPAWPEQIMPATQRLTGALESLRSVLGTPADRG